MTVPTPCLKTNNRLLISAFLLLIAAMMCSSCSLHKHSTKRGENNKTHAKTKEEKEKEKQEEKFLSDIIKHLKGDEKKVLQEAETWIGTPYKYAGTEKGSGADCSGFVMMVFKEAINCALPRNSAKQAEFCKRIKREKVKPGDLVFFATGKDPTKVSHVGIMVDDTNFIHASSSKGVVISSLKNKYYTDRLLEFGKVPCMNH